ncbi:trypsin-like peptidase domain-containing protein [Altererythrobacter sp.]|uniref:S1C family serine protease n=1 Tax=Altererythrobacter sp. TaxID=1872480 RepID=UPI001B20A7BA|nr:trypsin-like peptidase domain-containing protein [Altererythrobacter sp.]MBO6944049.1 trypsin-like peptidase domain-containing protein [Altererythrobacter sp.]
MGRIIALFATLLALVTPHAAWADSADIDAAARGVVRVVIVGSDGREVYPVSHGSGFAVSPTQIVTNAHVIREALQDDTLRIGVVPSEGDEAAYARAVSVSPRNDLALIEIIDNAMRLPPLTISGSLVGDMGEVSAVGYPMNVDRAQGLDIGDIFRAQPPVKSRGFLSGARPSRQFDTILHTAPIARGNSGGPLLDGCGRVMGVNSFGADSDGSDAEFYFAVSIRELLPFLRENDIEPSVNALPCRSIDEVEASERARIEQQRAEARERIEAREAELRDRRNRAQLEAQLSVQSERENAMAAALILLMIAIAAGYVVVNSRGKEGTERRFVFAAAIASVSLLGAIILWISRPGIDEIDRRVETALNQGGDGDTPQTTSNAREGTMICTLVPERSRVTGARTDDVEFDWAADGCVNTRTQYGLNAGEWTRVLVPDDEEVVSVNRYDPDTRTFLSERYLLGRNDMAQARDVRAQYEAPTCSISDAASVLGEQQQSVISLLPNRPNERLVYSCSPRENAPVTPLSTQGQP